MDTQKLGSTWRFVSSHTYVFPMHTPIRPGFVKSCHYSCYCTSGAGAAQHLCNPHHPRYSCQADATNSQLEIYRPVRTYARVTTTGNIRQHLYIRAACMRHCPSIAGRLMRDARVLAALNWGRPRFDISGGRGMEVMLIGFGTAVWKQGCA